jgi:Na+/H+ antiporter NhaC
LYNFTRKQKKMLLFIRPLLLFFALLLLNPSANAQQNDFLFIEPDLSLAEVEFPEIVVKNIRQSITFNFEEKFDAQWEVEINGVAYPVRIVEGKGKLEYGFPTEEMLKISSGDVIIEQYVNPIPLWLSIVPPLIAILMALAFKEVISSLFLGIFSGAAIIHFYAQGVAGIFSGLLAVIDTYLLKSLENPDHLSVIIFSLMIGAMVTLISKNGGMQGVVNKISSFARTAKSGQIATYLLGIAVFFDDYANTLIVGNTMRPVSDKLRISREKLSYIVDSTAAPIAAIAFVTTWIGAQLGYIKDSVSVIEGYDESAYSIFMNSLPFAFYPVFTLVFMLILILKAKDFGPMLKAERRARKTGRVSESIASDNDEKSEEISSLQPVKGINPKAYNAILPVLVVIFGTIAGLLYTGRDYEIWNNPELSLFTKISLIIGNANSYKALLWSSMGGLATAILLTISQKIMSLPSTMESMVKGFKAMATAVLILVLAWSLALVTEHLHTADFISGLMIYVDLTPYLVPALTFILAALVAFSTGSSWGTMAIMYPLMLPATWYLCLEKGISPEDTQIIFYNVVSTVLAGSVLGDHCSPISDTTILSSLATSCNHIDHVRTQLPYALTVGLVSLAAGTIPGAYGIPAYITMPVGIAILFLIVKVFGKKNEDFPDKDSPVNEKITLSTLGEKV